MKLYLVRHAAAVDGGFGMEDFERYLTAKGRDRMRDVAKVFRKSDEPLDRILTSPRVRAVQTAEILAHVCEYRDSVDAARCLSGGGSEDSVDDLLETLASPEGVALVGHEPDMGRYAAYYLGVDSFPGFKKGAICAIDLPPDVRCRGGKLVGYLHPKSLEWIRKVSDIGW